MSPDLPDRLLGLSIDEPTEQRRTDTGDEDEETYERFLFVSVGDHRLALAVNAVKAITDRPAEITRIPRSAAPISGVTDLRGEITVVIDPHVHFPDAGDVAAEPALLVLDRPSDEQPAAIVVDDVYGVETVPEDDVLDEAAFTADEIDGSALAHPLVTGIVRVERRSRPSVRDAIAADTAVGDTVSADRSSTSVDLERHASGGREGPGDVVGVEVDEFSLSEEDEPSPTDEPIEATQPEPVVEVEATPLIDVDRLLLASGRATEGELEPR